MANTKKLTVRVTASTDGKLRSEFMVWRMSNLLGSFNDFLVGKLVGSAGIVGSAGGAISRSSAGKAGFVSASSRLTVTQPASSRLSAPQAAAQEPDLKAPWEE